MQIVPSGHASPATHREQVGRLRGALVDVDALDDAALLLGTHWMLPGGSAACRRRGRWTREGFLPGILVSLILTGANFPLWAVQRAGRQADLTFGLPSRLCDATLRLRKQLPHPLPGSLPPERIDSRSELKL